MKFLFQILSLAALAGYAAADIVVDNEIINPDDIYDIVYSEDSDENWKSVNTKKYYCMYRNLWTKIDHPVQYPQFARLSSVIMYSSTTGFLPWLRTRSTTVGVELLAESGFNGKFLEEVTRAGTQVLDQCLVDGFTLNQVQWEENYKFMPSLEVTDRYRYLNGIAALLPSPDWFTGFYLFDTVDEFDLTFFSTFLLHIYPWDAGTDTGDSYTSFDADAVPADNVKRFTTQNSPGGIFKSPEGSIKPVGELECKLYVCPPEDVECEKPDWPPANGCDVFRFPSCDEECDPASNTVCEQCEGIEADAGRPIFYQNCCQSERQPLNGYCNNSGGNGNGGSGNNGSGAAAVAGTTFAFAAVVGLLGFIV